MRWFIVFLFATCVFGVMGWWWNLQGILVDVASVTRGKLIESIVIQGTAQATNRVTITAPIHGLLKEITLDSGNEIGLDAVVAVIEPAPSPLLDSRTHEVARAKEKALRAELGRALAVRESAQANLKQVQKKKSAVVGASGQPRPLTPDLDFEEQSRKLEVEAAERTEERAKHELNAARAQLGLPPESANGKRADEILEKDKKENREPSHTSDELFEIRSPIEGQVLRILRKEAGMIAAGTPILEVGRLRPLEFGFDVLTKEATRMKVGASVQLRGWGAEETDIMGAITKIDLSATRRLSPLGVEEYRARVSVAAREGETIPSSLGDGYEVEGVIQIRESADVLKVPVGALFRRDGDWYVFLAKGGKAVETKVELGARNDREGAVVSGLSDYDLVILYPSNRVRQGSRLLIR